jgi:hypothetical protein
MVYVFSMVIALQALIIDHFAFCVDLSGAALLRVIWGPSGWPFAPGCP